MKKGTKGRTQKSDYTQVGNNVYYDGTSYRVRVSVNGVRVSKNFSNKTNAMAYRRQLLQQQKATA